MITDVQILSAIKNRLSAPNAWTKGVFARDAHNHAAFTGGPLACQWCLIGAIMAETRIALCGVEFDQQNVPVNLETAYFAIQQRIQKLLIDCLPSPIKPRTITTLMAFNDSQETVAPVIWFIEKTIEDNQ